MPVVVRAVQTLLAEASENARMEFLSRPALNVFSQAGGVRELI